jgi:ATP-binding protein involved in chromosome partitioning
MALSQQEVIDALRPVQDPEIRQSIVDLDMVSEVEISDSALTVTVLLTIAGCPMRTEITNRVTAALTPIAGSRAINVTLGTMSDEQRTALGARLRGNGAAHPNAGTAPQGHAHGPSVAMPFMEPESRTRVILMSSGKGGVGKSSVSVNVAVALAQLGQQVGILDADIYGFSVPKMMNIQGEPVVIEGMIMPPVAYDVSVVSAGYFVPEDQALVWRGPMLHKLLEQFLTDVHWGEPNFLILDMPPGTGDISLSIAQYLPRAEVIIVTTPNAAAQRVAQRMAAMADKVNLRVTGVIENMSWFTGNDGEKYELFGNGGGADLAEKLGVPLVGQIPLVSEIRAGGDVGMPIVVSDPDSEAAKSYRMIAEHLIDNGPTRRYRSELKIMGQ